MDQYPVNQDEPAEAPGAPSAGMPIPVDRRWRPTPQLLLGMFVIATGIVFMLDNLGIVHAEEYLRYWPLALIAVGLLKLSQGNDGTSGTLGGLVFTLAGLWLLLEETAVIRVSFWDMWPLLLVLLGTYMVWQGAAGRRGAHAPAVGPRTTRSEGDADAAVNAIAILGGVQHSNNSRRFRGGSLTAIMGGCELDLREASIEGEAFLDVFAMWGGIEIRIPEDWTVVSHVLPLLGGLANKTRARQGAGGHRLVVRGFAIMGGIEIKN